MARWLSWLERRPVTAEVVGSNPIRVAISIIYNLYRGGRKHIKLAFSTSLFFSWDLSSAGRASALQAGGHRFEPCILHRSWTTEYGSLFLCLKINERNFVYIVIRLRSRKDSFFSEDAL